MNALYALLLRLRFRWHAFLAALALALPVLLDQLQVIDLKPILLHFMAPEWVALFVGLMPFYIALLKPMLHLEDHKPDA
jgi:hypothetical protein